MNLGKYLAKWMRANLKMIIDPLVFIYLNLDFPELLEELIRNP